MNGPDRQFEQQELEGALIKAEQIVQGQQITAAQEEEDARELEMELREAELTAARQKEAEEKGQESERRISEVAGA